MGVHIGTGRRFDQLLQLGQHERWMVRPDCRNGCRINFPEALFGPHRNWLGTSDRVQTGAANTFHQLPVWKGAPEISQMGWSVLSGRSARPDQWAVDEGSSHSDDRRPKFDRNPAAYCGRGILSFEKMTESSQRNTKAAAQSIPARAGGSSNEPVASAVSVVSSLRFPVTGSRRVTRYFARGRKCDTRTLCGSGA
jgi:hypothetical protein